ncbi:Prp18 domain-containing protein [Lipomyces japonicus]|uniref:Prp18 domain-containing protein n=1 Tax=Lipomyces japonicus TaxID=56871 RepID=UPI0034CE9766
MDFSALLANEIAKKRKAATVTAGSDKTKSDEPLEQRPKFIRRADVERQREAAYLADQARRDQARQQELDNRRQQVEHDEEIRKQKLQDRLIKKQKLADEQAQAQSGGGNDYNNAGHEQSSTPELDSDELKLTKLSDNELAIKFRQLQLPVKFFAESDKARIRRLHKAITKQNEADVFERKLNEIDYHIQPNDIKLDQPKVYLQLEKYVRYLIGEWEHVLITRESTPEQAFTVLNQTKSYLTPLLSELRKQSLNDQIFPSLSTLIMYLQSRQYRQANDTYIKLSVGNAAWPIGVTAVGIHERSSRERITGHDNESKSGTLGKSAVQVAHVMSDEKTRKWLTAVKRLITFAEGQWPE